jgi:N utilization substance protein A
VIIQKIREAEKVSVVAEFGKRQGEIVSGTVQRMERGNIYIDLGRATGILPYEEQIPGERYRQGERIRALLYQVEESPRGIYLRLSRAHKDFLKNFLRWRHLRLHTAPWSLKKSLAKQAHALKLQLLQPTRTSTQLAHLLASAVYASRPLPLSSAAKRSTLSSGLRIQRHLSKRHSPLRALISVDLDEAEHKATIKVAEDQQSLAIGRGGQNVRLAAKLTGWRIDIQSVGGEKVAQRLLRLKSQKKRKILSQSKLII